MSDDWLKGTSAVPGAEWRAGQGAFSTKQLPALGWRSFFSRERTMSPVVLILVVILIVVLLGGGYGYRSGNNALAGGGGLVGLILVILLVLFLMGHIQV
jgi:hypothetical protein